MAFLRAASRSCWGSWDLPHLHSSPCMPSLARAAPPPCPLRQGEPLCLGGRCSLTCPLCLQDSNLSLHTDNPDLTPCFQNSLLAWAPCIYLWATLPWYLLYLRRNSQGYIVLSRLCRLKTVRSARDGLGREAGGWRILLLSPLPWNLPLPYPPPGSPAAPR